MLSQTGSCAYSFLIWSTRALPAKYPIREVEVFRDALDLPGLDMAVWSMELLVCGESWSCHSSLYQYGVLLREQYGVRSFFHYLPVQLLVQTALLCPLSVYRMK